MSSQTSSLPPAHIQTHKGGVEGFQGCVVFRRQLRSLLIGTVEAWWTFRLPRSWWSNTSASSPLHCPGLHPALCAQYQKNHQGRREPCSFFHVKVRLFLCCTVSKKKVCICLLLCLIVSVLSLLKMIAFIDWAFHSSLFSDVCYF